jgi:hemerythrin superfamily protein
MWTLGWTSRGVPSDTISCRTVSTTGDRVVVPPMDAITLLRNDHKTVEQLFKRFEKAGDRAYVEKREIVDRIIEELSIHAAVEEQVFYPVARATVSDTEDIALESLEEHHIVKWLLSELEGLDPKHERFDAKVTVLMENVRNHVEEEQDEFFPKVRNEMGRTALADLGQAMADAKKSAPTHPHPRASDVPPGNSVVGTIAGAVDRFGDNLSGIAQGGVTAVQDLIARVAHTDKPKVSPTGSSAARNQAKKVRNAASAATDGVEQTARSVKSGATKTAKTAASGAKATATSAKKSARTTKSTAKRAATTTGRTAKAATKKTATTAKRAASKTSAAAKRAR